jgi:hypothetical protein
VNAYEALGRDLHAAVGRRIAHRAHKRRVAGVSAVSAMLVGVLSTAALASGVLPGLDLDPTKWEVLGRGDVDGRASYVTARERQTGGESTFLEERDARMDRYDAFLLNRKVRNAAGLPLEAGAVCTASELTRVEVAALEALAAGQEVAAAVKPFGCSGVDYGAERASWVYAREEPIAMLMPGARQTARRLLDE